MRIGVRNAGIVRVVSSGALAVVLVGCSGSGATNSLIGDDAGDGSAQASEGGTGGDATGPDGSAGADGTTGADAANATDAASESGEDAGGPDGAGAGDAIAPDVASDTGPDGVGEDAAPDGASGSPDGTSEAAANDGSVDSTVSDGQSDAAAPDGPGPSDSTVTDVSTDGTGPDGGVGAADATVDAPSGDAEASTTVDAASNDATGEAADAPGSDAPVVDAVAADAAAPDAQTDAPSDAAAPDAMACGYPNVEGGVACNSLCNTAPVLPVIYSTQPPPVATGGGAPPPGIYYATSVTYYFMADAGIEAGVSTDTFQETVLLNSAGPVYVGESIVAQNGVPQGGVNFQSLGSGTDLYYTQSCPTPMQATVPYSRTGGAFTVYIPNGYQAGGYIAATTLTLQTLFDGGTPSDAGLPDAGNCPQTDPDGGPSCTSICNGASPIVPAAVAADPPAATGGPVADGTYYLTARSIYVGADAGTDGGALGPEQETIVLSTSSDGVTIVQYVQSGGSQPASASTFMASGNTLYFTSFCPNMGQKTKPYSASGNTIVVFDTDGPGGAVEGSVYAKQ